MRLLTSCLCLGGFLLLASPTSSAAQDAGGRPYQQVRDDNYYFGLSIPEGWTIKKTDDPESFWRFSAIAPSNELAVASYAFKRSGTIDLEKLAEADRKLFNNIGELEDESKIRKFWFFTTAIERKYGANGEGFYSLARFYADGSFGFITLVFSRSPDFSKETPIIESFNASIPGMVNLKTRFSRPWKWLGGLVLTLMGIGILYLLGKTGRMVRKGLAIRRYLENLPTDSDLRRGQSHRFWERVNRRASLMIWCPVAGWAGFYLIFAMILSLEAFLFSLLGLVVPVLGYFGFFFVPTEDGSAYLP